MGFFDTLSKRKNRQPGGAKEERVGSAPRLRARLHPKVHEAMELLGGQPDLDDDELADRLGLTPDAAGPFIWKARKEGKKAAILREQPEELRPREPEALTFLNGLKTRSERSYWRIKAEVDALQATHYQGRPLAFLTEAERREIGQKISTGLKRYHAQKRLQVV
jgi:hypothetical protein